MPRLARRPPLARLALLVGIAALLAAGCLPASIRPTPPPTPTPAPTATPPPTPTPTPGPPTPTPAPTFAAVHGRARRHADVDREAVPHQRPRSIAYWNRDQVPDPRPGVGRSTRRTMLQAGWVLQILPGPGVRAAAGRRRDRRSTSPPRRGRRTAATRPAAPVADAVARRLTAGRLAAGRLRHGSGRPGLAPLSCAHVASRGARAPDRRHAHGRGPPVRAGDRGPQERAVRGLGRPPRGRGDRRWTPPSSAAERAAAFASMDGLLLTGGADLDPARYGAAEPGIAGHGAGPRRAGGGRLGRRRVAGRAGARDLPRPPGDERLRRRDAPPARGRPRRARRWGHGPALTHPLRLVPGTRLARILSPGERRRRRPDGQQLPPPGRATGGPGARVRAGRVLDQPGRATSSRRSRPRAGRSGWPSSAIPERTESHAEGVRAPVRVLRGRLPGAAARRADARSDDRGRPCSRTTPWLARAAPPR